MQLNSTVPGARRPWNIPQVPVKKLYTTDTPEQRKMCQNCPRYVKGLDCNDCIGRRAKPSSGTHGRISAPRFCECYNNGMNDVQMAIALGVSQSAVVEFRKRHGLKTNTVKGLSKTVKPDRPITPEGLEMRL
jgi:hypothetical protein